MENIKKFAVIGHPINHSKSPLIHRLFAQQYNIKLSYEKFDIEPRQFEIAIDDLRKQNYCGLNITLPFKNNAFLYCEKHSLKAKKTHSVNTLIFEKDITFGESTDGIGLIKDFENCGVKLESSNILLLGAGGAAQGVLFDLINKKPASISVNNRTIKKAEDLLNNWQDEAKTNKVNLSIMDKKIDEYNFDVIINATSAGLLGDTLPISKEIFNSDTFYYDMTYGKNTAFLQEAKNCGAKYSDGLGMLVCQAAESFRLWHDGKEPDSKSVIRELKNFL